MILQIIKILFKLSFTTNNFWESFFHSYVMVPSASDVELDEQVKVTTSPLITYSASPFDAVIVGVATKELSF